MDIVFFIIIVCVYNQKCFSFIIHLQMNVNTALHLHSFLFYIHFNLFKYMTISKCRLKGERTNPDKRSLFRSIHVLYY